MNSISAVFFVFVFFVYTLGVFAFGFTQGYDRAIDDMKKVRK